MTLEKQRAETCMKLVKQSCNGHFNKVLPVIKIFFFLIYCAKANFEQKGKNFAPRGLPFFKYIFYGPGGGYTQR